MLFSDNNFLKNATRPRKNKEQQKEEEKPISKTLVTLHQRNNGQN